MDVDTIVDRIDFDTASEWQIHYSTLGDDATLPLTMSEQQSMQEWITDYVRHHPGLTESPGDSRRDRRRKRRQIRSAVYHRLEQFDVAREQVESPVVLGPLLTLATIAYYVAKIIWLLRRGQS